MDLIKKKFEKNRKKAAEKKKNKLKASKSSAKTSTKKKKKEKRVRKKRLSRQSSSSSESSAASENSNKERIRVKLNEDAAAVDKKYRMAGALLKKPADPENFPREVMQAEWKEMTIDPKVTADQVKTLDAYLKHRAELKSTDHVVIAEKVDDDDKKATTRLKILTKYDEGRFAAIYMVQNEAAVNNDVVSVSNGRFMMKTALRLLSSHQITYRLSREINTLKSLWTKSAEAPQRIPPVLHEGRILGVPFYVTQIYDVNLEKCREEMGGGTFSLRSALHVGQEILTAIKFLHRRQIIHRDIKPTNVVLSFSNRDQWYLIDYGDAVANGKTSALSPPDGHSLTFLSREAHDLLLGAVPTTNQQDLESWWLLMVDMFKPLPWRSQTKVDAVRSSKTDFFANFPSDIPTPLLEIQKRLKSDTAPYKDISKKVAEGIGGSKEASGWIPEWYDRAATKKSARARPVPSAATPMKSMRVELEATANTTTSSTTNEGEDAAPATAKVTTPPIAVRKDQSVYLSTMDVVNLSPATGRLGRKPSKDMIAPSATGGDNKVKNMTASIMADSPPQQTPNKDRSVYFRDFPMATNTGANDNKRKYRYKPKGGK